MMGTADEIVKAPKKGVVFIEDLPKEEQAVAVGHSAGLFNLGHTCYMTPPCSACIQSLNKSLLSQESRLSIWSWMFMTSVQTVFKKNYELRSRHHLGIVSTNQEKQNLRANLLISNADWYQLVGCCVDRQGVVLTLVTMLRGLSRKKGTGSNSMMIILCYKGRMTLQSSLE